MDNVATDIKALREKLNKLNEEKEALFAKKGEFSKQIVSKINTIKQLRSERDSATDEVKVLKEERSELNKNIGTVVKDLKGMNEDKKALQKKLGLKVDPVQLKAKIDKLNERIETEVLDFKKEQAIMKQIKTLQAQYKNGAQASELFSKVHTTVKDLKEKKKVADGVHEKIQKLAQTSQSRHEQIVKLSKEVDDLKVEEKKFDEPIAKLKAEIREINEKLGNHLGTVSKDRKNRAAENAKKAKAALSEKQKIVQAKLENGDKLTTEDLLILQTLPQEAE